MAITLTCGNCRQKIQAPDSLAGRKVKCPKCGQVLEVSAAAPQERVREPAARGDPVAELAKALEEVAAAKTNIPAAGKTNIPAAARTAVPAEAKPPAAPAPGLRPEPVKPQVAEPRAAQAAPLLAHPGASRRAGIEASGLAAPSPKPESDELIAMPPVGVQTPSGLSTRQRKAAAQAYRWQRTMASAARTVGFLLAGVCVILGAAAMILMTYQGRETWWLVPGVWAFAFMLILAALSALGGLLARHVLLLLADLSEETRRQKELLDRIGERLD